MRDSDIILVLGIFFFSFSIYAFRKLYSNWVAILSDKSVNKEDPNDIAGALTIMIIPFLCLDFIFGLGMLVYGLWNLIFN